MDPLCIDGQRIETADSFKFLGNIISNDLSWKANTTALVSKAHQRLYFLRQLNQFGLKKRMLTGFYRCMIESVLSFSICVWLGGLSAHRQRHLDGVVTTAERIIGCSLSPLGTIYRDGCLAPARKVISDHIQGWLAPLLLSGRSYQTISRDGCLAPARKVISDHIQGWLAPLLLSGRSYQTISRDGCLAPARKVISDHIQGWLAPLLLSGRSYQTISRDGCLAPARKVISDHIQGWLPCPYQEDHIRPYTGMAALPLPGRSYQTLSIQPTTCLNGYHLEGDFAP